MTRSMYPADPGWQEVLPPSGFNPSEDQYAALRRLLDAATRERGNHPAGTRGYPAQGPLRQPLVLVGPAGSGKTTIMRWIANTFMVNGWDVAYLAPTGKAAARISEVVGAQASTIHGALYGKFTNNGKTLVFGDPHEPCESGTLLVCDEASMVDAKLAGELLQWLPPDVLLLYVGDREQLPPVNSIWGVDLLNPTAALDTVHRQAALNPVLALATSIRMNRPFDWGAHVGDPRLTCAPGTLASVVDWVCAALGEKRDATLLCYTNNVRQTINGWVRRKRNFLDPVNVGDLLLIRGNNKNVGVMNGEVYEVERCSCQKYHASLPVMWDIKLKGVSRNILVFEAHIGAPKDQFFSTMKALPRKDAAKAVGFPSYRILDLTHIDYGYALTAHSAQGSQWKEVLMYADPPLARMQQERPDEGRRWLYTAVTRASEKLTWIVGGGT